MIQAVDRLAAKFQVDSLDMKADALANSIAKATPSGGQAINEAALRLAEEAQAAGRQSFSDRFLQIAVAAARATNNVELVRRTQERAKTAQATTAPRT
jgi:hypothetical protein